MGGSAFLIYGDIDPTLLERREIKPYFFQKLFGIKNYVSPKETNVGNNRSIIDIDQPCFEKCIDMFHDFLNRYISQPHSATIQFLEYLKIKTMTVFLRGEKSQEKTEWYVQFSFSGCAGLGEVSAELGTHWVEKWLSLERKSLSEFFSQNGFHISENQPAYDDSAFIPFEKYGYAKIQNSAIMDPEYEGSRYFELDQSFLEGLGNEDVQKMEKWDQQYRNYFDSKKCCCQICNKECFPLT
ncbi:hypothetical protein JXQ70_05570 [bacterium]|nr:hypothetical protein [bacterium]